MRTPGTRRPHNLPAPLTSFVGRASELVTVRSLLAGERLVTVAGAGGAGKTRLAARAAAADAERWPDGVWWVELQSVTDPAAVPVQVAQAVGALVEPVTGPTRSLVGHLRDAWALVCLDNCEHVLDAVADLVQALLTGCPAVSVLTTSREPLNVPGEVIWRLPTMRDDEALDLFLERARQVRPSFTVDDGNRPLLRRLGRRLDGIPLAIELAAAWAGSLSPQEIETGLDDRFALLVRRAQGSVARHQTLEASIAWSHDLLADHERVLLRRLAVFARGFGLDAARAVAAGRVRGVGGEGGLAPADILPALDSLVDRSLVVVDEATGTAESRFRLLESVRQYAWRQLDAAGELAAVRDRHLDHLLTLAERAEPLLDQDKDAWRALLEPERDELRAALDWGLAASVGDPGRGRRLAAATAWLWNAHGQGPEGLAVLRRAMGRDPGARDLLQARLMMGFALVGDTAAPGDLDPVRTGEAIVRELGDDRLRGRFLTLAAVGAFANEGDNDVAWRLCEQALELAATVGDEPGRDMALPLQGLILLRHDRHDAAASVLGPVTERLIARGERGIASTVLVFRSAAALDTGDVATAWQLAERAASVAEPLADFHRVGMTRCQLAVLHGVTGDVEGALHRLHELVRVVDGAGPRGVQVPWLGRTLGLLHLWRGDLDVSERWLAPEALPGRKGGEGGAGGAGEAPAPTPDGPGRADPLAMPLMARLLRAQDRAAEAAAVLDRAETVAREQDLPGVLAAVLDQRGHLAVPDDPARALDRHHAALQLRIDHGLRTGQIASLEALAGLMAQTGRLVDAARALAAAGSARVALGLPRPPIEEAGHAATAARLEADLPRAELDAARGEGARLTLEEAVALVRRSRGRRGRPASGWDSLTPTERDVVRLVAEGWGNQDVAAKLFVSPSTVKTHLVHVFAKLGVSNRTELAALATRRLSGPPSGRP